MHFRQWKRRDFITLCGGAAAAWPVAARAQQPNRMRRIGVLTPYPADDAEAQARLTAFAQGLAQTGWTVGQNIRIDYRWGDGKPETMRKYAAELVALAPEVILASSSAALAPLLEATRTVPIVFAVSATRLPPVMSRVWRGRAAMRLAFSCTNTVSGRNFWSCSRRSRRA